MMEKFNGIIYLIVFIIHFLGFGIYAYQMIINNKNFRAKFEMDETATPIMRMIGASFLGALLMALYIMFIRPGGVEGTWAFFNLIFVQNLCIFIVNTYSIKIDKTGMHSSGNKLGKQDILKWLGMKDVKKEKVRVLFENDEVGFEHAFATYSDGNREALMTYYKYKDGKVVYMETGATKLPK